jgi:hypothetical protein
VRAATTLSVPAERAVALRYAAGGPVAIAVDGAPLDPDPAGTGPVPFFSLDPPLRQSAPVRLAPGAHVVTFTCERTADLGSHDWYLWASAVDPDDGQVLLDVVST